MIASPFVFSPGPPPIWNDLIVGAVVALLGGYNASEATRVGESPGSPTEAGS